MMTPNHSANQPCDPVEQAYSWPFSGLAVCDSLHGLPKSWEDVYFFLPEFLSFLPRLPIRDWVPGSWGWSNPIQWYWSLWCQRLQWMCVALWRTGRLRTLELWFKVRFDLAENENHMLVLGPRVAGWRMVAKNFMQNCWITERDHHAKVRPDKNVDPPFLKLNYQMFSHNKGFYQRKRRIRTMRACRLLVYCALCFNLFNAQDRQLVNLFPLSAMSLTWSKMIFGDTMVAKTRNHVK